MIENDQLYADACFPKERWSVCGVRLKPFSIGHALILQSIGSPFLGFETPEFDDLMRALWVCSRTVEPGQNTDNLKLPLSWRIASRFLRRIARRNPKRMWASICTMQEYVFDAMLFRPPIATRNSKLSRISTCPAFIPSKRALMASWGYSEREVLNMPMKQAKIEQAAWLEHEGALAFTTQADVDIVAATKKPENVAWAIRVREENARKMAEKRKMAA